MLRVVRWGTVHHHNVLGKPIIGVAEELAWVIGLQAQFEERNFPFFRQDGCHVYSAHRASRRSNSDVSDSGDDTRHMITR